MEIGKIWYYHGINYVKIFQNQLRWRQNPGKKKHQENSGVIYSREKLKGNVAYTFLCQSLISIKTILLGRFALTNTVELC